MAFHGLQECMYKKTKWHGEQESHSDDNSSLRSTALHKHFSQKVLTPVAALVKVGFTTVPTVLGDCRATCPQQKKCGITVYNNSQSASLQHTTTAVHATYARVANFLTFVARRSRHTLSLTYSSAVRIVRCGRRFVAVSF